MSRAFATWRSVRFSLILSSLVPAVALSQAALAGEAIAAPAGKVKVAVGGFDGTKSDEARSALIDALRQDGGFEVTDAEFVKASASGRTLVKASKGLGVDYVITGKVSRGYNLTLKVLKTSNGKQAGQAEIKGGSLDKLKAAIDSSGVAKVGKPLGVEPHKAEAKPEEESASSDEGSSDESSSGEDEEKSDEAEASASASSASSGGGEGLSPLDVTAGVRPLHRKFQFHDTIADARPGQGFSQLLKYELPLGPLLFVDLNWYPASHFTHGVAEWLGITAGFEKGFATESVYLEGTPEQETLKTSEQQFYIGGRFRLPIGAHFLGAAATFGQHAYKVDPDKGNHYLIPDVTYTYVRPSIYGTFRFGDLLLGAHVGKRIVLSTGELKSVWFPGGVKAQSLDAGVMVGYRLVKMLDLVAGFDWLRYAFDFNPVTQPGPGYESYVAGGATDDYLSGYIGFRFHVPGDSEATRAAAPSSE